MDDVELLELAKRHPIAAQIVARDLTSMGMLYANPTTRDAADLTLRKWAAGEAGLRKAFTMAWLQRARGMLAPMLERAAPRLGSIAQAAPAVAAQDTGEIGKAAVKGLKFAAGGLGVAAGVGAGSALAGGQDAPGTEENSVTPTTNDPKQSRRGLGKSFGEVGVRVGQGVKAFIGDRRIQASVAGAATSAGILKASGVRQAGQASIGIEQASDGKKKKKKFPTRGAPLNGPKS